jgi:hypothetical protein
MLQGAIESVTGTTVTGWIYAAGGTLRGRPVLAFVDESCVGSGEVALYRKDLADAGLGDGFHGFRFPIALALPADAGRVVIRLEGSDAALLPAGSRVTSPGAAIKPPRLSTPRKTDCLRWMRSRGWLEQQEFDYLTFLDQFGVYDRILTPSKRGLASGAECLTEAKAVARDLLELHYMTEITLGEAQADAISDLPGLFTALKSASNVDVVVAIRSSERARIGVTEGSHRTLADEPGHAPAGADYLLAPDRLLILNTACVRGPGYCPV